jgi:hypothetical protein
MCINFNKYQFKGNLFQHTFLFVFLNFTGITTFFETQRYATLSEAISETDVHCISVCLQTIASGMWTILETILLGIFILYSTVRSHTWNIKQLIIAINTIYITTEEFKHTLHQGSATCGSRAACGLRKLLMRRFTWFGSMLMREGQKFSASEEHLYTLFTLFKFKGKQSQTNILTKQKFCTCRRYSVKVHGSVVKIIWHLTKQYENYCDINNWSLVQLTVTGNQNCLKVNKQRLYNKLSCMEKYSYYLFQMNANYTL